MPLDQSTRPKGSILLKLLILVLLLLLLTSILIPKSEWEEQSKERDICRLQMENLSYVIREYGIKTLGFIDNLDDYLAFIRTDSVLMDPARYEIESLTRDPESGKDSLLVEFSDVFRLSHFAADTLRRVQMVGDTLLLDSVQVRAVPRPQFEKIPVSTLVLTSESPITVFYREKNIDDRAILVYSDHQINYDWILPDPVLMKSSEALISLPVDSLRNCPTSHEPYKLNVNVRSRLEGTANFLVHKDTVDAYIGRDTLMVDLFNHRLKTEALAEVLVIVKEDTTLIEKKDSILVAHFLQRTADVKHKQTFEVTGDHTITVPADSMVNWEDSLRIRRAVFVAHVDSLSLVLKGLEAFRALLPRVSYTESYKIAKVDTIGVTVRCPIDSLYHQPDRSILMNIFGVGPARNHGYVENGDLSWSEKR